MNWLELLHYFTLFWKNARTLVFVHRILEKLTLRIQSWRFFLSAFGRTSTCSFFWGFTCPSRGLFWFSYRFITWGFFIFLITMCRRTFQTQVFQLNMLYAMQVKMIKVFKYNHNNNSAHTLWRNNNIWNNQIHLPTT